MRHYAIPARHLLLRSLLICGLSLQSGVAWPAETGLDDLQTRFEAALEAREDGDPETARDILQQIITERPDLHRARLELALALYDLGSFDDATAQANTVLKEPSLPPKVRLSVLAFLAKIKAEKAKPVQTSANTLSITLGMMHDTNVNIGAGANVTGIAVATPGAQPLDDIALVLHATADLERKIETAWLPDTMQLSWQADAGLYSRKYHRETAFNLDVLSASTGPALVGSFWRAGLSASADYIRFGHQTLAVFSAISPGFGVTIKKDTEVLFDFEWEHRNYTNGASQRLDSSYRSGQVAVTQALLKDKLNLEAGYKAFDNDSDTQIASYNGYEWFVGASWKAWKGGSVFADFSREKYKYEGLEPTIAAGRRDIEEEFVAGVYHVIKDGTFNDWAVTAQYTRVENDSNAPTFAYDREQVQLTFGRSF